MMVSLVIPTLNEAENILPLIKRLDEVLGGPREIIVVDDDSHDGTWKIATESAPLFPNSHLRVVRRRQDHGLARSLQAGLDVARGDIVVIMDADLSMPPEMVPELVRRVVAGNDLAIGSRYLPGGSPKGHFPGAKDSRLGVWLSSALNVVLRLWLSPRVTDYTSGFAAVRRELLEDISFCGRHGEYFIALAYLAQKRGYKVVEVPYACCSRARGESKTGRRPWDYARRGWRYAAVAVGLRFGFGVE
ncbi:MAG: polyprenol monophosphomannose synthase [Elusimicrobia bacterium]|nr:polyprenol monophosphomannose synthase [Elusimicrobiota bacterium]